MKLVNETEMYYRNSEKHYFALYKNNQIKDSNFRDIMFSSTTMCNFKIYITFNL